MTIFLSDLHLGHKYAGDLSYLYKWLENQSRDQKIYLVGDIFDDHRLRKWPSSHYSVLFAILSFGEIFYCPGNHDKAFRELVPSGYTGMCIANVLIKDEFYYEAGDGKHYLVTHGDQHDSLMKYALVSSRIVGHTIRKLCDLVHGWFTGHTGYTIVTYAKQQGYDGVICGHTHDPEISTIEGLTYVNLGDWNTVVIEHDGVFNQYNVLD
jgi:UDP-2,3-diacylglucosamine pyrophosphatase LpxH